MSHIAAPPRRGLRARTAGSAALLLAVAACGSTEPATRRAEPTPPSERAAGTGNSANAPATAPATAPSTAPDASAAPFLSGAARRPTSPVVAPLAQRRRPDVLVTGPRTFSPRAVAALSALAPAGGAVTFRTGQVTIAGRDAQAIGVDPSAYRPFAAQGTAEVDAVWQAVARGEAVTAHKLASDRDLKLGAQLRVVPGSGRAAEQTLRLGALASVGVPAADLVVNDAAGRALGLPSATGMLLTASIGTDPVDLAEQVRRVTGAGARVDLLTAPAANPVAFLTGGKAAKAFGAFSYRYFADGTIEPDATWVDDNIRTEEVPIFGRVTCHRLMLPQLRGALQEIVAKGKGGTLHTYNGCYVPRFIERNPQRSVSLHTWGIAIDLDAATNYRGIAGTMDPEVVAIFKRWGFRWGGDWTYTDPMHFELGALLDRPS